MQCGEMHFSLSKLWWLLHKGEILTEGGSTGHKMSTFGLPVKVIRGIVKFSRGFGGGCIVNGSQKDIE